ncbi:MAG: heavy-metal-associated domain-containing protein [candidate division Zixibacteria bacterium]|nr:heavy-metal-associated domain-containing protein [candidate division Zixibacteria bacterium]
MRRFAFICMAVALAVLVAAPAMFACDGAKTEKASASGCGDKAKVTTTAATNDNATVQKVGATCGSKDGAMKAGASCTGKEGATKAGATCTAAEKAACMGGAKTTTAGATLPNGHPSVSVAEALKCGDAKVAFVSVDKMHCNGCVESINKAIGSIDGVCAVETSLEKKTSTIVFHADKVKTDDVINTISKAGYVASLKTDCTEDMKAVFGSSMTPEQCQKQCANSATCTKSKETKTSES